MLPNKHLNEFEKTLLKIDSTLKKHSVEYTIIGGLAAIIYGRLRTTEDIDITLLAEIDALDKLYDIIIAHYTPLLKDSKEFFKRNYVLPVIDTETNVKLDFAAGLSGFDKKVIERRIRRKFGSIDIYVCSIEDLIIYKLVSARPQDIIDLEEIKKARTEKLDYEYLQKMARYFIEVEREDVLNNLNKLLQDVR